MRDRLVLRREGVDIAPDGLQISRSAADTKLRAAARDKTISA
jgi:hypothetical protein